MTLNWHYEELVQTADEEKDYRDYQVIVESHKTRIANTDFIPLFCEAKLKAC